MKENYPNTFRSHSNISEFFERLFQLMAKSVLLLTSTFFTVTLTAQTSRTISSRTDLVQSSSCRVELRVEKDRNIRSTPPEGTYYSMIITNTGSSADTFSLATLNINGSCSNTDKSSSAGNVNLTTSFLDSNLSSIKEISLNAGQSTNFFVHITVPVDTAINKWCCTQVTAQSKTCSNYKMNIVLNTFVINPNED
jgi:hypothetical protein